MTRSKSQSIPLEDVEQGLVHDDDAVAGVGGDVAEVVAAQTRVERVEHRAHQRDREVELEMLGLIPEQCGDSIAGLDAQAGEPGGEPAGTLRAFADRPCGGWSRRRDAPPPRLVGVSCSARSTSVVSDSWKSSIIRPFNMASSGFLTSSAINALAASTRLSKRCADVGAYAAMAAGCTFRL